MRKFVSLFGALAVALIVPASLEAAPIVLTPSDMIAGNLGPSNCEPGCVEDAFGATDLTLLYKADVGGSDSGAYADSYNTVFANTASDPADATISYVGGPSISCPECYLAIKDGNQVPSYYFYDLSAWDGISDIIMTGFWPGKGAISHVSIWGGPGEEEGEEEGGQEEEGSTIPEPASVLLIGLGMAAVAARMRQRKA